MHLDHMDARAVTGYRRALLAVPLLLILGLVLAQMPSGWGFLPWLVQIFFAVVILRATLLPQRRSSSHLFSLGSVALLINSLLALAYAPIWSLGLMIAASVGSFVLSGYFSLWRMRPSTGVPQPSQSVEQAIKVAMDECVIGYFANTVIIPRGAQLNRIVEEVHAATEYFEQRGWIAEPARFHDKPNLPDPIQRRQLTAANHRFEMLQFSSGYRPPVGAPGALRWQDKRQSPDVYLRLMEHPGAARPWLFCLHGYRMGSPWLDFRLFKPAWLHHQLGFNLALPILPLHGLRKAALRSGDGYLDGDLVDIVYTQAQAQSDLRQCVRWLREQNGVEKMAVFGYSLGGYNAALLSALESDFEAVIAAIPLVDITTVLWNYGPRSLLAHIRQAGIGPLEVRRLLRVVSPLAMDCQLPPSRRFILAGCADRIVPLPPTLDLWHHWGQPQLEWFDGTHLSVKNEDSVPPTIESFLRQSGMLLH